MQTRVSITEEAGRIYIRITGPHRDALARSLMREFPGHRQLYFSHAHDRFRIWGWYRARLAAWLEATCEAAWIAWEGR